MLEKMKRTLEGFSQMNGITRSIIRGGMLVTISILFCSAVLLLFSGPPGTPEFQFRAYATELLSTGQAVFLVTTLGSVIAEQTIHNNK